MSTKKKFHFCFLALCALYFGILKSIGDDGYSVRYRENHSSSRLQDNTPTDSPEEILLKQAKHWNLAHFKFLIDNNILTQEQTKQILTAVVYDTFPYTMAKTQEEFISLVAKYTPEHFHRVCQDYLSVGLSLRDISLIKLAKKYGACVTPDQISHAEEAQKERCLHAKDAQTLMLCHHDTEFVHSLKKIMLREMGKKSSLKTMFVFLD